MEGWNEEEIELLADGLKEVEEFQTIWRGWLEYKEKHEVAAPVQEYLSAMYIYHVIRHHACSDKDFWYQVGFNTAVAEMSEAIKKL